MRMTVPMGLRWSDLDAYGHVNNVAIVGLLEEARIQVLWVSDEPGESVPTAVLENGLGHAATMTLLARQEIEYLAPVPYTRRPVVIEMWFSALGGASLDVCYEVRSPEGVDPVTVYARAATTLVLVDAASGRPRRIDDRERSAWQPYLEERIAFRRH
jgi:acyl-CoA thioester hydrolase